MMNLNHNSFIYRGLGDYNKDDCLKKIKQLIKLNCITVVLLVASVCLFGLMVMDSTPEPEYLDLVLVGVCIGLSIGNLTDFLTYVHRIVLRMKEIEEGDEE